jgi:hypothetical protein
MRQEIRMHAEVGDEIVVGGRHLGDEDRTGAIVEVHGKARTPPYLVRRPTAKDPAIPSGRCR